MDEHPIWTDKDGNTYTFPSGAGYGVVTDGFYLGSPGHSCGTCNMAGCAACTRGLMCSIKQMKERQN